MQRKEFLSKWTWKAIKRKQLIICKLNENRNKIVDPEQKKHRQNLCLVIFSSLYSRISEETFFRFCEDQHALKQREFAKRTKN